MTVPALASVNPRDLSAAQRRCLKLLADGARLARVPNGYKCGLARVPLDVALSLRGLGLVSTPIAAPLALTYGGKAIAAILADRRRT